MEISPKPVEFQRESHTYISILTGRFKVPNNIGIFENSAKIDGISYIFSKNILYYIVV